MCWVDEPGPNHSCTERTLPAPVLVLFCQERILLDSFFWHISFVLTKSTAGTAILSKHKPLSVETTVPGHPDPESVKGRIITLEFASYYVVGTYVVNAGQKLQASFLHSFRPEIDS